KRSSKNGEGRGGDMSELEEGGKRGESENGVEGNNGDHGELKKRREWEVENGDAKSSRHPTER
ncbi:hypothetical protein Csa_005281, partial [Cucumis sativus]